ncbi:hypothetical protein R1sor_009740 [Riccia sorocarpa]|uniref:Uncharacterized protein n=1 Tax=Riccia sorocarpa TaxID=122646 RepID=A0ABD3HXZ4_9MARC
MRRTIRGVLLGRKLHGSNLNPLEKKPGSTRRESIVTRSIKIPGAEKRRCVLTNKEDSPDNMAWAGDSSLAGLDQIETQRLLTQLQANKTLIEQLLAKSPPTINVSPDIHEGLPGRGQSNPLGAIHLRSTFGTTASPTTSQQYYPTAHLASPTSTTSLPGSPSGAQAPEPGKSSLSPSTSTTGGRNVQSQSYIATAACRTSSAPTQTTTPPQLQPQQNKPEAKELHRHIAKFCPLTTTIRTVTKEELEAAKAQPAAPQVQDEKEQSEVTLPEASSKEPARKKQDRRRSSGSAGAPVIDNNMFVAPESLEPDVTDILASPNLGVPQQQASPIDLNLTSAEETTSKEEANNSMLSMSPERTMVGFDAILAKDSIKDERPQVRLMSIQQRCQTPRPVQ